MLKLNQEEWPIIIFEDTPLNQSLSGLSVILDLEGLSEDTADWIWRLCNCRNFTKNGNSTWVKNSVSEILDLIQNKQNETLDLIRSRLSEYNFIEESTYSDWLESLEKIKNIANSSEHCHWTGITKKEE